MQLSGDRILTTHAGSLPRPDDLTQLMYNVIDGRFVDEAALAARVRTAVAEVVAHQIDVGIDVISDGEMGKVGFAQYVSQRYSGFSGTGRMMPGDLVDVPGLTASLFAESEGMHHFRLPVLNGPMESRDPGAIDAEIADFLEALGDRSRDGAFISSVSPGQVTFNFLNRFYPSHRAYIEAAAEALRPEYEAIVAAGVNLQLDSPELAMAYHCQLEGGDLTDPRAHAETAIEALNGALESLPPERLRLHVCWGNYRGPHHKDVDLRDILEPILKTRAKFISVEAANPRHEHEWDVWRDVKLPDDKALIVGVIDTKTNHVEHPRLIAQRLERFASLVGKERVIAGTDCGFATSVGVHTCHPEVAWMKLAALAVGAQLASENLW